MEREAKLILIIPGDELSQFEEAKYKYYKFIKTSGECYVKDFINALEA